MKKIRIIDNKDIKLLNIIQNNARISNVEIAKQLGIVPSAVLERIRKLEKNGVIQGYETRVDAGSVGRSLVAYLFITTEESVGETGVATSIARIPEVQEVHAIAGEDCYLVKLRVENPQELAGLLRKRFGALKSIRTTRTTIVLETFKETMRMPLTEDRQKKRK